MRWTDKLGGRKFIISVLALMIVTFGIDLDGQTKLAFISGIIGLYGVANVSSKRTGAE